MHSQSDSVRISFPSGRLPQKRLEYTRLHHCRHWIGEYSVIEDEYSGLRCKSSESLSGIASASSRFRSA
uniref:Uncharacterized protein n=1 Tax=Ascaris lumbricoides TaxID=6252 RepID=A0A0M3HGB4_ASCLU